MTAFSLPVRESLSGEWQLKQARGHNWYPATVPGTVHTDLMASGVIEDPYIGFNERAAQWVDKEDWIYRRSFDLDPALAECSEIELCFDGLDTYADVKINGVAVLKADNMFRRWRVPVKGLLKDSGNEIEVYFRSPIKEGLALYDAYPVHYRVSNDQSANGGLLGKQVSIFTRKAGYHYGWDWGPRLVTSGIWRDVRLEGWNESRISDVFYRQKSVSAKLAELEVEVEIEAAGSIPGAEITISAEGVRPVTVIKDLEAGANAVTVPLTIRKPRLWWSLGLGEQYLYSFKADLSARGHFIDERIDEVGLRSIKLIREDDADGRSFRFELNGVPVFMKGANYIPNDLFLPRFAAGGYEGVVGDAAAAGMNMLRVWGGGVYEDDRFYALCDRIGILIWQDFMFSCSIYPYTGALRESSLLEAEDNVRRLRNHACIALWCGNNECCDMWYGWGGVQKGIPEFDNEALAQLNLQYYHDLPAVVEQFAPGTAYTPSSPWSPEGSRNVDPLLADSHFWVPWQKRGQTGLFEKHHSRFYSEYGFQSLAGIETIREFAPDRKHWDVASEMMMFHQRGGAFANGRMMAELEDAYFLPEAFENRVYMSQIAQGDVIRTAIESHRRDKPLCWGTLVWQLNDCWPVASWAGRDWYGTWKPQHYYCREAYRDVLLSAALEDGVAKIWVVSDRLQPLKGTLEIRIESYSGEVLSAATLTLKLPANSSTMVKEIPLDGIPVADAFVRMAFTDAAGLRYGNLRMLTPVKDAHLPKVCFSVGIEPAGDGYDVTVSADRFAKGVYLHLAGTHLNFSDNYFDLCAGESRTAHIASSLTLEEFADRLSVMSVIDARRP